MSLTAGGDWGETKSLMSDPESEYLPYKYVVVKYIPDVVRDEPINIGVILQSTENFSVGSKFITEFYLEKIKERLDIYPKFLAELTRNIRENYLNKNDRTLFVRLHELQKNFGGQVRLTEPRVTLASNLEHEVGELFETFISIRLLPEFDIISSERIQTDVYQYLRNFNDKIMQNVLVKGKKRSSGNKFSLGIVNGKSRYLQTISYDQRQSDRRTIVFDWSVADTQAADPTLNNDNFGAIIARPSQGSQNFHEKMDEYRQGLEILGARSLQIIEFEKSSEGWKDDVRNLIP